MTNKLLFIYEMQDASLHSGKIFRWADMRFRIDIFRNMIFTRPELGILQVVGCQIYSHACKVESLKPKISDLSFYFSAYGGRRKCWNNSGHCRKKCAADEVIKAVCKNHQSCCVPRQRLMVLVKDTITSSPSTYGWEGEAMDRIVPVAPASTYWE